MTRPRTRLLAVLLVVGAAVLLPGRAHADDPLPQRATGAQVKSGQLLISVGLQDLFGPAERQHLTSGFSTRVLIRVALQDASREGANRWRSRCSARRSSTTSGTNGSASA